MAFVGISSAFSANCWKAGVSSGTVDYLPPAPKSIESLYSDLRKLRGGGLSVSSRLLFLIDGELDYFLSLRFFSMYFFRLNSRRRKFSLVFYSVLYLR